MRTLLISSAPIGPIKRTVHNGLSGRESKKRTIRRCVAGMCVSSLKSCGF